MFFFFLNRVEIELFDILLTK